MSTKSVTLTHAQLVEATCEMFERMHFGSNRHKALSTGKGTYIPISQGELEYELLRAIRKLTGTNVFTEEDENSQPVKEK